MLLPKWGGDMDIKNISTKQELLDCLNSIYGVITEEKITDINYYKALSIASLLLKVINCAENCE